MNWLSWQWYRIRQVMVLSKILRSSSFLLAIGIRVSGISIGVGRVAIGIGVGTIVEGISISLGLSITLSNGMAIGVTSIAIGIGVGTIVVGISISLGLGIALANSMDIGVSSISIGIGVSSIAIGIGVSSRVEESRVSISLGLRLSIGGNSQTSESNGLDHLEVDSTSANLRIPC